MPPYRAAVEEFYRTKRGSLPTLEEAWAYFLEEVAETGECLFDDDCCGEVRDDHEIDREHLAKELGDAKFTLEGLAIAANIDLDEAFRLVVASNMTKERTPEGKVRKSESYIAPNMASALL